MKPVDRFNHCISDYLGTLLNIIGFNVTVSNYHLNYRSIFSIIFLILMDICAIYTIFIDETLFGRLISGIVLLINFQTIVKLYYLQRKDDINSLLTTIRNSLMDYDDIHSHEHRQIVDNFATIFQSTITTIIWMISTSVVLLYLSLPIVIYVVCGTYQPMLPILIPAINGTDNFTGFAITTLYHMFILTFDTISIMSVDLLLLALLSSPICFAYLIGWCTSALNMGLSNRNYTKLEAKVMFRKVIQRHQEMVMCVVL